MSTGDPDTVERYLSMLRRDSHLLQADVVFDAVHYGDAALDRGGNLPDTVNQVERSVNNILRHLERIDQYGAIAELDILRLLHLMDRTGPAAFAQPSVAMRLRRICDSSPRPLRGSLRHKLERRVIALAQDISYPPSSQPMRVESKTPVVYDVFIAYNSRDYDLVRPVVESLRARGIRTWMDQMDLPPGTPFQDRIEDVLRSCRAAAIFVGPDGLGPWERFEVRIAVSECVRRGLPVIPVMLDGAGPEPLLPLFLREFRMVRFHRSHHPTFDVDELIWGITGQREPSVSLV